MSLLRLKLPRRYAQRRALYYGRARTPPLDFPSYKYPRGHELLVKVKQRLSAYSNSNDSSSASDSDSNSVFDSGLDNNSNTNKDSGYNSTSNLNLEAEYY